MARTRTRLAILLVLALALVALTPMIAHAAPPRPSIVTSDAFEPDDTTTTAKPLQTLSTHTLTSRADVDVMYVDIDATGTPLMAEATWKSGFAYPDSALAILNPDGSTTSVGSLGLPFGGVAMTSGALARAPMPGRYFVITHSLALVRGAGSYELYAAEKQIRRVSGGDRFSTAVEISRKMWSTADAPFDAVMSAEGVPGILSPRGCVIATGRNFADALAAGAWIAKDGMPEDRMPILLTEPDSLNPATSLEIQRLATGRRMTNLPFTVYVVGGPMAVSDAVTARILGLGGRLSPYVSSVVRVGGDNRFQTAALIAAQEASSTTGISDTVFITNGFAFADALSAGPVAARVDGPILLATREAVPPATAAFLTAHPGITKAVVVGGPSVVATSVLDALSSAPFSLDVTRVAGASRWETSRKLAEWGVTHYGMIPISETLVTGGDFPDGLAAAGISAFNRSPVLLTPGRSLSSEVATFFAKYPTVFPSYLIGGPTAVSPAVEAQFDALRPPAGP